MSSISDEIKSNLGCSSEPVDAEVLEHYGMPRRSGRYPWGSGENPYQHGDDFLSRVESLKKDGWEETPDNIRNTFGMTTTQYRTEKSLCKDERRMLDVSRAKSLKEDGLGATEIGRQMGISESTVRSLLNADSESRMKQARNAADFMREQVDKKGMVDVGKGVERELHISEEKMNQALTILEREGYHVYNGRFPQATNPNQMTTQKVLTKPDIPHSEIYDLDKVKPLTDYFSTDDGETFHRKFTYPESLDPKRLMIRYNEDGGIEKDGVIELRRGCQDLSLGDSKYAQVRIMVDGKKYLKGMAVYSDNMPDGVDVIFNTNKTKDVPKMEVLKDIKSDPDNPFGSLIKDADQGGQYWYKDAKTGEEKLGLINKRADQGDWTEWKNALPSQFLGKQSVTMAKKQLDLAKADKAAEYDEIMSLTNPVIKKHYLQKFAEGCDSAAVNLQAAALPGQRYHVIIPFPTMKDTEVYAPNYETGTKLALIRYPHGGTFEIPILTVNNNHKEAKRLLGGDVQDAIGINSKVAERLSGADFDGDTVMCIPTHDAGGKVKITSTKPLKGLEGFDPKVAYGGECKVDSNGEKHYYRNGHEYRIMKNTQTEMGMISNLITDMTLAGAGEDQLAAAVRHSMVVIDAEKHKLDYKQSEHDNNISALRKEYQPKYDENGNFVRAGGAATILSRSKGETSVPKRQGTPKINQKGKDWYDPSKPEGALIYKTTEDLYYPKRSTSKSGVVSIKTTSGETIKYKKDDPVAAEKYTPVKHIDPVTKEVTYTDKTGTIEYAKDYKKQQSTKMAETDDANTLVSKARHPMELLYADYANSMKAMANQARLDYANIENIAMSKEAKKKYASEVKSLEEKLNTAELNAPRERAAQRKASVIVGEKKANNKDLKVSDIKKASQQAIVASRIDVGASSRRDREINITDKEWEAIQAGAITNNMLVRILNNANADKLRERAMPKQTSELSTAKVSRIKALAASNYTLQEIANKLGVSTSTVSKYLKGVK